MAYTIPFLACCKGDPFGQKRPGTNDHRGQDVAPGGQDFPSWVNGTVVTAGSQACLGNRVVVQNDDDGFFVGVSHLANIKVSVGQRVSIGTPLGNIGNTGDCSKGRHAHITVSPSSRFPESGAVIDPVKYAASSGGGGGGGTIGYNFGITKEDMVLVQRALAKLGLYSGPDDGDAGPGTVTGMQVYLRDNGFLPADYVADGEPGPVYGGGLQHLAAAHGYTGPIDNNPGAQTSAAIGRWANTVLAQTPQPPVQADWKAWQAFLTAYGYTGPIDGVPGEQTYMALQRFLQEKFGYAGPIDGVPGENTWNAFQQAVAHGYPGSVTAPPAATDWGAWQTFLRVWGYEGPIDGEPGENTYLALQKFLAANFAYAGPIDGDPGDFTWAAFDRAIAAGYPNKTPVEPPKPPVLEPPLPGSFFVDTAKFQIGINYAKLKADYVQANIVKSAGFNTGELYIADGVTEHTTGTREAGMFVGHYYVPGAQKTAATDEAGNAVPDTSPAGQARWWIEHIVNFDVETDLLMLDNEKLDSNGVHWNDAQAAEFIEALREETGIPYRRIVIYQGANDWRTKGPWPMLEALRTKGLRFLWAAYGNYPTGTRPDHVPSLQGSITDWDIHQYTSTAKLGGWTTGLDANYSRIPISELWKPGDVNVDPPVDPCKDCPCPEPEPCPPCDREAILSEMQDVIDSFKTA